MKHYKRLRAASRHAAVFISLLAITSPAFGEEVYGKVILEGSPFNGTLTLSDGSKVDISNGDYKLFVPAGDYPVIFEKDGKKYSATIHSSTVRLNRDINLPEQ